MPELSIGIPVRNGSKTIRKTLDSILNQTYKNFHVIISDNASNDDTAKICLEYSQLDSRIMFIQQNEDIGFFKNFPYLLQKSTTKYFIWLAADDYWESDFLKKNIDALENNSSFVASASKIDYYDREIQSNQKIKNTLRSKIQKYHSYDEYFKIRKYQDRVSFYLRRNRAENIYGLFRQTIIKKCVTKCWEKTSVAEDLKILLFIQKFGEINLLNETLLHRSAKGISGTRKKKFEIKEGDFRTVGRLFPRLFYSCWIFRNLGPRVFFNNIDYILLMNFISTRYQLKQFFKLTR